MKLILILLVTLTIGCINQDLNLNQCFKMEQNNKYLTEKFKIGYTIQFPPHYEGRGHHFPAETPSFEKRSTSDVNFHYSYDCSTDCHRYFGEKLPTPIPEEKLNKDLDKRIDFCENEELLAIMFYNSKFQKTARLFMKTNNTFKEGLLIQFKEDKLQEVISIIKTIKKE